MPAHQPLSVVLFNHLVITPCPLTHDRLGRPIVGPCLIWDRATDRHGYGVIGNSDFGDSKIRRVHRVMYGLFNGLALDEFGELDHLCRVHACASAAHLEEATHAENVGRGDWGVAWQARRDQTECINGHKFDEENTYHRKAGGRDCRACHRSGSRRRYDPERERARKNQAGRT
jgi:hypothetical protein